MVKKKQIQPAQAKKVQDLLQKAQETPDDLTPKEKMIVKKMQKVEQEFERMRIAAAEN